MGRTLEHDDPTIWGARVLQRGRSLPDWEGNDHWTFTFFPGERLIDGCAESGTVLKGKVRFRLGKSNRGIGSGSAGTSRWRTPPPCWTPRSAVWHCARDHRWRRSFQGNPSRSDQQCPVCRCPAPPMLARRTCCGASKSTTSTERFSER
jgi:hypothetical protein